jgi:hypothetical protein
MNKMVRWTQTISIGSVVAGTMVALTATAAAAYWSSSGNGTASAQAGSALNPTTSAVASVGTVLVPGGSGNVTIKVNNPNGYPVRLSSVVNQSGGTITGTGGTGTCTNTDVTFTNQTGLSNVIAAGGNVTITFANAASMGSNPDQGCQNATITIPVTVTVSS